MDYTRDVPAGRLYERQKERRGRRLLIAFIEECDADELSDIFGDTFGYDVSIDQETEQLECTPNGYCGFILEGGVDVASSRN